MQQHHGNSDVLWDSMSIIYRRHRRNRKSWNVRAYTTHYTSHLSNTGKTYCTNSTRTQNKDNTCALALLAAAAEVALTEPTALSGYGTSGLQIKENGKDTCA